MDGTTPTRDLALAAEGTEETGTEATADTMGHRREPEAGVSSCLSHPPPFSRALCCRQPARFHIRDPSCSIRTGNARHLYAVNVFDSAFMGLQDHILMLLNFT